MKKIIQFALGYKNIRELNKLEYKLTSDAFFRSDFNEKGYTGHLRELENLFNQLPLKLKIHKISHINRYQDSTTTDEPMLYSCYESSGQSYNIIIKTYLLNIMQTENLTKIDKALLVKEVQNNTMGGTSDELKATLEYLLLDSNLNDSKKPVKSQKI